MPSFLILYIYYVLCVNNGWSKAVLSKVPQLEVALQPLIHTSQQRIKFA